MRRQPRKPTRVLAAIEDYYLRDNANVHRGVHTLAERATAAYEAARERVRSLSMQLLAEKSPYKRNHDGA